MEIEQSRLLYDLIKPYMIPRYRVNEGITFNVEPWMAIFYPKFIEYKTYVELQFTKFYYNSGILERYYPTNPDSGYLAEPFDTSYANKENLTILFINTSTGTKIYDYTKKLCEARPNEYKILKNVTIGLTQSQKHKVFVCKTTKVAYVLSNNINKELVDNTIAYLPIIFADEHNWNQPDNKLIDACKTVLKKEDITPYITDLLNDAEKAKQKEKLNNLKIALNSSKTKAISKIDSELNYLKSTIASCLADLKDYYKKQQDYFIKRLAIETQNNISDESVLEVFNYINQNKLIKDFDIKLSTYTGTKTPMLTIRAPITIYEIEPLEKQLKYLLEDHYRTNQECQDIVKAFKRIFVDEEFIMFCDTKVIIDIINCKFTARYSSNDSSINSYEYMIQPHLTLYNCWGENESAILKALVDGDFLGALNNILIATQNINFTDSAVLTRWIDTIEYCSSLLKSKTCLSKVDGKYWSIEDIINSEPVTVEDCRSEEVNIPELEE